MFEKEAKEYVPNINWHAYSSKEIREEMMVCYQKGAEFGYNKANEWHFVKNGDFPKENKKYLVLTSNGEPKVDSWLNITWLYSYDVIAWKEIVPPKES